MPDINAARQIWIAHHAARPVLALSVGSLPELVEPAPVLQPCAYIDSGMGGDIANARLVLMNPQGPLMAMQPSPEGQPLMTGTLFQFRTHKTIDYIYRSQIVRGQLAEEYDAAAHGGAVWDAERSRGIYGSFLIGFGDSANVWQVHRFDADHLHRTRFVLRPIKLPSGLPEPDFSTIGDALIREQARKQWGDMEHALAGHRYDALIMSAKQVVETFLYAALLREGYIEPKNQELSHMLNRIKAILEDEGQRKRSGFTDLGYHLAHKLRILHAGTHVGRPMVNGRPITPEFALTVAQDAKEVLASLGAYKRTSS